MLSDKVEKIKKLPVLGVCGDHAQQRRVFTDALLGYLAGRGCSVHAVSCGNFDSHDFQEELHQKTLVRDVVLVDCQDVPPFAHVVVKEDGSILPSWAASSRLSQNHALESIKNQLGQTWVKAPVWGCVLIGGKSRRMGSPKHLITEQGVTWVERSVELLRSVTDQVVVAGAGKLPATLVDVNQIEDDAGLGGPIAGVLSAMRWKPDVSWLVAACDLPDMRSEALQWLLKQRKMGIHAVMPDMEGKGRVEPLLAYYDFRCREKMEAIVGQGSMRINRLFGQPGVISPTPPKALQGSWRNVNSPKDMIHSR